MKLYHYTKRTNFRLIWEKKTLKFSEWTNTNDVFEREKIFRITYDSADYYGKRCDTETFRRFVSKVFEEIQLYKQISLCQDYDGIKGYASPLMWGYYARYKRGSHFYSGVCFELDYSKLNIEPLILSDKIKYVDNLESTDLKWIDEPNENIAAQRFVRDNIDKLFFYKHKHWWYENEFRLISKEKDFLDISNAISAVYVLGEDKSTINSVKQIVKDKCKIEFLNVGGLGELSLIATDLHANESGIRKAKAYNRRRNSKGI